MSKVIYTERTVIHPHHSFWTSWGPVIRALKTHKLHCQCPCILPPKPKPKKKQKNSPLCTFIYNNESFLLSASSATWTNLWDSGLKFHQLATPHKAACLLSPVMFFFHLPFNGPFGLFTLLNVFFICLPASHAWLRTETLYCGLRWVIESTQGRKGKTANNLWGRTNVQHINWCLCLLWKYVERVLLHIQTCFSQVIISISAPSSTTEDRNLL